MSKLPFRLVSQAKIQVSLAQKRLYFYQGTSLMGSYPVAIGKWSTPTPIGNFSIFEKTVNPGGVFGSRWMAFYEQPGSRWGIHGTNNPASIGNAVSLGCIRMHNHDVEAIFPLVSIGTLVEISQGAPGYYPGKAVPKGNSGNWGSGTLGRVHTVQKGETLWSIAQRYGVPVNNLISMNNISNPHQLAPGQLLKIS